MYHWAHGALIRTCNFLNEWFGAASCQIETGKSRGLFHTPEEVSILFDPKLGGDDAKCSCEGVDRWGVAAIYARTPPSTICAHLSIWYYESLSSAYPRNRRVSTVFAFVLTAVGCAGRTKHFRYVPPCMFGVGVFTGLPICFGSLLRNE